MSLDLDGPNPACFAVRAAADPGTLSRLIEPFAKRGLVPSLHARVAGDALLVDLQVALEPDLARSIAEALRQLVVVERVLLADLEPVRQAAP